MLKMTGVEIEKISDRDKYMFFEQGIRGDISYINKKCSEASENVNILYLDMNNLCGCAICQYLPIDNFKWVKDINKIKEKLMRIKKKIVQLDMYLKQIYNIQKNCVIFIMIIH